MGHAANSYSLGSERKLLAVYREEKSSKETKTYKIENTDHHKVIMLGVFVQHTAASLLIILSGL